jgi:hypothetical protein
MSYSIRTIVSVVLAGVLSTELPAFAQQPANAPAPADQKSADQKSGAAEPAAKKLKPEELEQVAAPVALYPDALLAQVLMASTYPLEIVQAARWVEENSKLKGEALETEAQKQPWDPSVKSLVPFPQVLSMMNEKLDWTQKLGDAVLAQQTELMDAVQKLRAKAKAEGTLKTTEQQKVEVQKDEKNPEKQIIVVESASPEVVYVPTYNPTVVYGAWPYPAYPPYAYYPPGYAAAASVVSFGVGVAVGAAMWGGVGWGWGGSNVQINNINTYNRVNRTAVSNNRWQHDPAHRRGVEYRDPATRERYGRSASAEGRSREDYRGREGRQGERQARQGERQASPERQARADQARSEAKANRGGGAFEGSGSGRQARAESARGSASRGSGGARASGRSRGGGRR